MSHDHKPRKRAARSPASVLLSAMDPKRELPPEAFLRLQQRAERLMALPGSHRTSAASLLLGIAAAGQRRREVRRGA